MKKKKGPSSLQEAKNGLDDLTLYKDNTGTGGSLPPTENSRWWAGTDRFEQKRSEKNPENRQVTIRLPRSDAVAFPIARAFSAGDRTILP